MKEVVVLLGGAGYIGSHTAYALWERGYNVVVIDSFVHKQPSVVTWGDVVHADMADAQAVERVFATYKVLGVLHFASFIEVGVSVHHPARFYYNNVTKTLQFLDIMRAHKVNNLVFSSSCAVYGAPQTTSLKEDHPRNPVSPYGKNKLIVEFILEDYQRAYGLEYVALRYFNAAGVLAQAGLGEMHDPESHVIPLLLQALMQQKPFKLFGSSYNTPDGSCIRDYIHVMDLASAHIKALEHLLQEKGSTALNLGSGAGHSVKELIAVAEQIVGKKTQLQECPPREGDVPILLADNSKACQVLQWVPHQSSLHNIMTSAYAWEKKRVAKLREKREYLWQ